ncbi:MAG TPA: GGDEF domain-containing protein [Burkholderiales bacterium]|nr:GGDEF domain-containing protein [Burkholderiales bacterium]
MKLTRLFAISTVVLVTLIGLMLSRIIFAEWSTYQSSRAGLVAMQVAYKAMVLAEKVSFERGPTNGVLGDADTPDPAKRARLAKARADSDAAMADLSAALVSESAQEQDQAMQALQKARALLTAARAEVDQVAGRRRSERPPERVMGAVHQMFDVIPVIMEAVTILSRDAEEAYPRFSDALVGGRLAAELREYAGRLGSQFTAALTEQTPLGVAEQQGIHVLRGRIEQLRILIELPTHTRETDERILAAVREMEQRYFGDGLAFIAEVERASAENRPYGMDTAQFAARYVPDMASIVQLRDVLIKMAIDGGRERNAQARRTLISMSMLGAATLLVVAAVFLVIRQRVLRPLLDTTRVVVDIAQENLSTVVPPADRMDEIGDMLRAVGALKAGSLERRRLEEERGQLIEELRQMSSTDFLTGLLNRRAFAGLADSQIASARRHGAPLSLIIFDIDHFKKVNDLFGHDAGDTVLVEIARIARATFREEDFVARHGGEEFVALAPHCDLESAHQLAERLREAIEAATMLMPDGRPLNVTASFGVVALTRPSDNLDTLLQGADRALYAAKESGRNRVTDGATRIPA